MSMSSSPTVKNEVLDNIASGNNVIFIGKAKYKIGENVVHVRFCSTNKHAPRKYKFNINPNTLSSNFELWICGGIDVFYLIPIGVIESIYHDPDSYQDRHHPRIKIVSIDTNSHCVTYAKGGKYIDVSHNLLKKL